MKVNVVCKQVKFNNRVDVNSMMYLEDGCLLMYDQHPVGQISSNFMWAMQDVVYERYSDQLDEMFPEANGEFEFTYTLIPLGNPDVVAEFMGMKLIDDVYRNNCNDMTFQHDNIPEGSLMFESSWDWLMLVVKKILEMEAPEKETVGWYAYWGIDSNLSNVDIEMTYGAVVEFIKWHNEQLMSTTSV